MQAGTRIVIDSVVALLIALVARTDWHDGARRVRGMLQILGACALGLLGVLADSRLSAIAENGAEGDGSFFARIYQSSIRYADCSPIRGRCSPVMARATSSMRCGPARPKPDGCWTVLV